MTDENFTGINIQFPISRDILAGKKVVETRTYPIPKAYLGVTLLMVETPGPKGKFKSRIVAKIRFSECFLYSSKRQFYGDSKRHLVTPDSPWAWADKPKWGWVIDLVEVLDEPKKAGKTGIRYTKNLRLKSL